MHVQALEADKLVQVDTFASPRIICATRCRLDLEKGFGNSLDQIRSNVLLIIGCKESTSIIADIGNHFMKQLCSVAKSHNGTPKAPSIFRANADPRCK